MKQKRKGRPLLRTGNRPEITARRSTLKFTTKRYSAPYRPASYAVYRKRGGR